jgi:hypothetical protein
MPSRRDSWSGVLLKVFLGVPVCLLAVGANADVARVEEPLAGTRLVSGTLARVKWSGLPVAAKEMELLLSLNGGASFKLRLTGELDPELGEWLWRVPNLPSQDVRLRIRYGIRGCEVDGPTSAPFTIVTSAGGSAAPLRSHRGELWPARVPLPLQPSPTRGARAPAELVPLEHVLPAEEPRSGPDVTPRPGGRPGQAAPAMPRAVTSRAAAPRLPRTVPLRR